MKAWRLHGYGDFRFEEVAVPDVKSGWVLLKVKVVQPGVVDKGHIDGTPHFLQSRMAKKFAEGIPIQLGHEYCGEVVEIGQGVTSLKIGDRVSSEAKVSCRACRMCQSGQELQCLSPKNIGVDIPGAFAEYMCMPEWGLVKISDGPTDNEVAALQPLSCCLNDVRSAGLRMGDSVVVMGQGAMGLGCLQIAKLSGAGLLIAVDARPETLVLSRSFGADVVINSHEKDPIEEIRRFTNGYGVDVVFEAAGGRKGDGLSGFQTAMQALQIVRVGGKVIQAANLEGIMELDTVLMRTKNVRYIFPDYGDIESLRQVAFLLASNRIKVGPQISHVLHGLEKLPEAIEITVNKAKHSATNSAQIVV